MATPKQIIDRLQKDFDCRLSAEQIIGIINVLEKRLALDVVKKTQITTLGVSDGVKKYELNFPAEYVTRVFVNKREIKPRTIDNQVGYECDAQSIVFYGELEKGYLYIESIVVPEEYSDDNIDVRQLFLGDGYDEIYLYHILSREALMSLNIDMLNNYSLLYGQALNSIKDGCLKEQSICQKYNNIW